MGSEFWTGLKSWIKEVMLEQHGNISPDDIDLIPIVDTPDEVMTIVKEYYDVGGKGELEPNFTL